MNELITTKQEVYILLEKIPETRNSDMFLYLKYCVNHLVRETEMYKVFENSEFRKSKKVAPFESVSRARRELQSEFVSLRSEENIRKLREKQEETFKNFYGKGE